MRSGWYNYQTQELMEYEVPELELVVEEPGAIGVILDANGNILKVVEEQPRRPFGFARR